MSIWLPALTWSVAPSQPSGPSRPGPASPLLPSSQISLLASSCRPKGEGCMPACPPSTARDSAASWRCENVLEKLNSREGCHARTTHRSLHSPAGRRQISSWPAIASRLCPQPGRGHLPSDPLQPRKSPCSKLSGSSSKPVLGTPPTSSFPPAKGMLLSSPRLPGFARVALAPSCHASALPKCTRSCRLNRLPFSFKMLAESNPSQLPQRRSFLLRGSFCLQDSGTSVSPAPPGTVRGPPPCLALPFRGALG